MVCPNCQKQVTDAHTFTLVDRNTVAHVDCQRPDIPIREMKPMQELAQYHA